MLWINLIVYSVDDDDDDHNNNNNNNNNNNINCIYEFKNTSLLFPLI